MLESTTQPCPHCHGTGLIRSDDSLGLQVLRALEEEGTRKRSKEVLLKAPIGIINFLINEKREHIALIEARYGMAVRIECDPALVSPDYSIEKFKTATRMVSEAALAVISGNSSMMGADVDEADDFVEEDEIIDDVDDAQEVVVAKPAQEGTADNGDGSKKKRKRRRRRRGGAGTGQNGAEGAGDDVDDGEDGDEADEGAVTAVEPAADVEPAPKPRGRTRSRTVKLKVETVEPLVPEAVAVAEVVTEAAPGAVEVPDVVAEKPKPKPRTPRVSKAKAAAVAAETVVVGAPVVDVAGPPVVQQTEVVPTAVEIAPVDSAPVEDGPPKPKRKGWWALGR